jgi:pimeloyl-ACP methyl ester carboxylesterase
MPTLERPTVTLSYSERGSGTPLVFLHGWCDGSSIWDATIDHFAGEYRCIAPDMRGHGGSGFPRDHAYFPEALSNDVVAICEAAGADRPILVGHSFGGFLAAFTAMRYPGFARAIVVEDQVLALRPFGEQMRAIEGSIRGEETHMAFRSQLYESMVSPAMSAEGRALIQSMKEATPVVTGTSLWAVLFEYTLDEIEAMGDRMIRAFANQPTLTIESQPNPDYHALVRSLAPTTRTEVIEGGHWVHLEHPDAFRQALRRFLAEV